MNSKSVPDSPGWRSALSHCSYFKVKIRIKVRKKVSILFFV